jgi:mRNA interferase HicA
MLDNTDMKGREFIRRVRKLGRKQGVVVRLDRTRGKGSHGTLYYGARLTVVAAGEIPTGTLRAMCRQIGIATKDL